MMANYQIKLSVRPVTPLAEDASGAPVRPAAYQVRWADLMMLRTAVMALVVVTVLAPTTRAAEPEASSVLSGLKVSKGSVEWHGLVLGMPLREVERILGQSIHLSDRTQFVRPPDGRVVVDKRSVRLTFFKSGEDMVLKGLAIERMAFENPEVWTRTGLVRSLTAAGIDATARESRAAVPGERSDPPILYVFPSAPGIQLLLKPDDGTIYLGLDEYFVD